MKAVDYIAKVLQRETGKTKKDSLRLARHIVRTNVVRAIREGPELVPSR